MLRNLVSTSSRFYEDQALIFLTFGGFGRYVLSILSEEFDRLGISDDKVSFLAFDTEEPHRDRLDLKRESDYFFHLDEFDGDIYIDNKENVELRKAVDHIPENLLHDIEGGCKGVPAVGFVAFHKYDEILITKKALRVIDDVRAKNPGKKIKLIIISGMGGSVSNGMTVPFLYRIRERLREKRVRVEAFLATSEGYLGLQNIQEEGVERNCVASAMLWEYAAAGRNGLVYPGKNGVRDKRMFDGKIAHRMYVFSGGSAETSLKYQAIASTMAMCISTLELTKVGSYLDGDRVNYAAHILEKGWSGQTGNVHPTNLMTMNVAGLKADCLPQVFHLYSAKRVIEDLSKAVEREDRDIIEGKAISSFLENNLNEDEILNRFKIEIPTLTRQEVNQSNVSEENIYAFLKEKMDGMHDAASDEFEKKKELDEVVGFTETVISDFSQKADEIVRNPEGYLKGGLLFYEKLSSLLAEKAHRLNKARKKIDDELLAGTNQQNLVDLMEKLAAVTKRKGGVGQFVAKVGQSSVISLVNQILDMTQKIQQQKIEKYNHLLLQHIYDFLSKFIQEQQDYLKNTLYKYNVVTSQIDREVDRITRIGRSAFTYNKSKYDELTEHLMEEMHSALDVKPTQQVIEELGWPLMSKQKLDEKNDLEGLLNAVRPDINGIKKLVDKLFSKDQKVFDYVKTSLDQFFMTLKLDRDRFPALETSQCRFVMCTKAFYDRYKDDLFEGYNHIETENPFNVIVTQHEEGFPFIAISYMHRINRGYKELRTHNETFMGHIMSELDEKLPMLDS